MDDFFIKAWCYILIGVYCIVFGVTFWYVNLLSYHVICACPYLLLKVFLFLFVFFSDGYSISMFLHTIKLKED